MSNVRPEYVVRVEYEGVHDMDPKIKKVAKRYWDSSGYEFKTGIRDLSFYRKRKSNALNLFSKLSSIPNIRVMLEKYPGA